MENLLLSVEDNPDDVLILRLAFEKAKLSASFQFLSDGEQAIDYFSTASKKPLPTLLLLDIKLPRKSGMEVLAWIREQPSLKRLPIIMLSASNRPEDIDQAYNLGANSYLVKPSRVEELVELTKTIDSYWFQVNARPTVAPVRQGPGLESRL